MHLDLVLKYLATCKCISSHNVYVFSFGQLELDFDASGVNEEDLQQPLQELVFADLKASASIELLFLKSWRSVVILQARYQSSVDFIFSCFVKAAFLVNLELLLFPLYSLESFL